jgi:hypothetical protein
MVLVLLLACSEPEPPPPTPPPLQLVPRPPEAPAHAEAVLESPPTWGQQCRDDADCPDGPYEGHCYCAAPLPEGGAEAVGFCWSGKVKTGEWWCTVQDGHAFRMGLIFP